ncbi:hypothetical protein L6164_032922 [Bauhinia variegata]|uniref:Uncharacterized protein n=1 Tax=Bauhinia variegata TaxID=167791 RepID=A0ACB9KQA1_BAUVA|nr:hypothetical protein L6164_032922 [Bauhinia variegata]
MAGSANILHYRHHCSVIIIPSLHLSRSKALVTFHSQNLSLSPSLQFPSLDQSTLFRESLPIHHFSLYFDKLKLL